jgi:hypothetical protein
MFIESLGSLEDRSDEMKSNIKMGMYQVSNSRRAPQELDEDEFLKWNYSLDNLVEHNQYKSKIRVNKRVMRSIELDETESLHRGM